MLTVDQFSRAAQCSTLTAGTWLPHIEQAMQKWGVNSLTRAAGFIAQMSHESQRFNVFEEALSYSAARLVAVWPKRFPTLDSTVPYAGKPQALANYVYANRMGNGDAASGDGYRYRGRGPKQITGKYNYTNCGAALGLPLVTDPDLLLRSPNGAQSAGWFWQSHHCNELIDAGDFVAVTVAINGGTEGLDKRTALWNNAKLVLGVK